MFPILSALPALQPYKVIAHHIGKLHRFGVPQGASAQLAREIGNALAPSMFVCQHFHHFRHGQPLTGDIGFDFVAAFLGFVLHIYNFPLFFGFALWYNGYAKPHIPFAAGRCFVLDENPLGFPPMYPCSYGMPIDFAVSCGFYHKFACIGTEKADVNLLSNSMTVTFDENFALATGVKAKAYNMLIAVITAVIIVLAMNLVGSLLISALIVFPALCAMRLFKSFKQVIICAAIVSVVCATSGILISVLSGTPVGSTIVAANIVVFVLFSIIGKIKR